MWFTETPWPPIAIFAIIAAILLVMWSNQKRALPLIGAAVLVVLSLLTLAFEHYFITDAERVEHSVVDLAWAFQRKDGEKVLGYFSPDADKLRAQIKAALLMVEVKKDLDLKDLTVTLVADRSRAISRFRANASVAVRGMGDIGFHPSRWEFTWQREGGEWKITKVVRLHVLKEEELGFLDPSL